MRFQLSAAQRPWIAVITGCALLLACSKNEIRPSVEVEHYQIDWERVGGTPVQLGGIQVRGVIFSPAQWPLETSLKRAMRGDFHGVIDGFNLRFQSSNIPSGVLEDLYNAGYLPAYVQIANTSDQPAGFLLSGIVVRDSLGAELLSVDPDELPAAFKSVDWKKTGIAVGLSLLVVVLILAIASGKGGRGGGGAFFSGTGGGSGNGNPGSTEPMPTRPAGGVRAAGDTGADQAVLRSELMPAKTTREGVLFFRRSDATIIDWTTAHLATP